VPLEEQVMIIYAGTHGYCDPASVEKMRQYEQNLLAVMRTKHPEIGADIAAQEEITEETEEKLKAALEEFNQTWVTQEEADEEIGSGDST
jgi:F-type H+-transporting ATPase subunit alpha